MINNRQRSQSMAELAATMGSAISALSLERFSLWGISFGGKLALSLAVQAPERLEALVLAAPAAIRAASGTLPSPGRLARSIACPPRAASGRHAAAP